MAGARRVVLIDGSALLYRAFYAIPASFRTSSGIPTNATYGFATSFRKLLSGRRPELGAVVFDAPGPTFRDDRYPEYKAQRPRMPDELRDQLAWIDKVVEAHHFPILRVPGYEADDVIGTLTREAVEAGDEVFIVSGDKDFAQLIGDRVRMIDTMRDITYDAELVRKKWGVPPEQFIDLLALMGDKVDNIPGVPGIGQKGAAKLLDGYGNLDGILAHVEELKGRARKSLEEHRDDALLSRELATIDARVPLERHLEDLVLEPTPPAALNALYRELEFYSLLSEEEVRDAEGSSERPPPDVVRGSVAIEALLESLDPAEPTAVWAVYDLPSPITGRLCGLALRQGELRAYVPTVVEGDDLVRVDEALVGWLLDDVRPKLTYAAKYLLETLRRHGGGIDGVRMDVMLASFLIDPTRLIPHELDQLAREWLQRTLPPDKRLLGSGKSTRAFSSFEDQEVAAFVASRLDALWELGPIVEARLEEEGQTDVMRDVSLPMAGVLADMEMAGIAVDRDDLERAGGEFRAQLADLERRIHALAGHEFNIGSTKQLSKVLFEELGLPVIKRTKTGYSTNAEVLERLSGEHEIARLLLEQRKLAKLINTYVDVLGPAINPETGRIHADFQQTVGATGRLISTDPDLQRTPIKTPEGRRIRQAFVAPEGTRLISADWSQIELRLLAHFTGDPHLVEAFQRGQDVHRRTAGQLFGCAPEAVTKAQRSVGKLVNFSTIYGQGATALGQIIGVPRKEAQAYIDGYFAYYAGVRQWLDATIAEAHEHGYVTTLLGRRRYIPELSSNAFLSRQAGERIAANTPIQGSAADLCKLAMLRIHRVLRTEGLRARMLLQIHDELVFEAPMDEVEAVSKLVRHHMEHAHPLGVPLVTDVGVGRTWAEAKA